MAESHIARLAPAPHSARPSMVEFARRVRGPVRVYLTGGATAVLEGFREMTKNIDLSFGPEPLGAVAAIRELKDWLDINVEPASSAEFAPPLPGWRERSRFIQRFGDVDFFHYDVYTQTLSKLERGHGQDLKDARAFVAHGWVEPAKLRDLFSRIRQELESQTRYVGIDPEALDAKVRAFLASVGEASRA